MSDAAALLLDALRHASGPALLVADENCLDFPFRQLPAGTLVISNRYDVALQADTAGLDSHFSDLDFSAIPDHSLTLIACRLSKEKAVVHHIANQAARVLAEVGALVLVGGKQEGIKTFAKTLCKRLDGTARAEKHGPLYQVTITRGAGEGQALDDDHYSQLREIARLNGKPVVSKPGQFGWDKIDEGSAMLAAQLPAFLAALPSPPGALLDLGCGYGYLSLAAVGLGKFTITATDNCAAAVIACRANFAGHGVQGQVVADNAGASLTPGFDAILCNPPFHQGFDNDRNLTRKFLTGAHRLLDRRGRALFVVNSFVPLERLASEIFTGVDTVADNGRFKLVVLSRRH